MQDKIPFTVLMAEDDDDDRFLVREAFEELEIDFQIRFVGDGEELLYYLHRRGKFSDPDLSPTPAIILLDLNMPKKDGRKALSEIKSTPSLIEIPTIIFTTSDSRKDKMFCRKAGADEYIIKPNSFPKLVKVLELIVKRWHTPSTGTQGQ